MRVANLFHDKDVRAAVAAQEQDAIERLARRTPKQRELLPLLVEGRLNKQVAGRSVYRREPLKIIA
jgi:FixJ family two-component response regulator